MLKELIAAIFPRAEPDFSLASFYDPEIRAYGIASIPKNLKDEIAAVISRASRGHQFDAAYIAGLGLTADAEQIFKATLLSFLLYAKPLIGDKSGMKRSLLRDWRMALYFVPDDDVNASVRLSSDERCNTVFILVNTGVILALLHRFCALFAVPGFFEAITRGVPAESTAVAAPTLTQPPQPGRTVWLSSLPNSRQIAIAQMCTIMAAMSVLMHEIAHFMGGHLAYLRAEKRYTEALQENGWADEALLPKTLRRLLELDADQLAGAMAATLWRQFDHPYVGPEDAAIESFHMELVLSTVGLFVIFEEYGLTDRYYSPRWRVEHFLEHFSGGFFVSSDEPGAQGHSRNAQLLEMEEKVIGAVEWAYERLGWGKGFSFERIGRDTRTLLETDLADLEQLRLTLRGFMPHQFAFTPRR